MPLTDAGVTALIQRLTGSGTAFEETTTYIGVGDSSSPFDASQIDLQAPANKLRKLVTSAPSLTGTSIELSADFDDGQAEWDWQEWAVFNAESGGDMLCRRAVDLGAKTPGVTRKLTVTLEFGASS